MSDTMQAIVPLDVDSPEVSDFLRRWHEGAMRRHFEEHYPNIDYDKTEAKTARPGKRWIKLDCGTSGRYMVDRFTRQVFAIKGYGVPNLRKPLGSIDSAPVERMPR